MFEIVVGILVPIVAAWGPPMYQALMKGDGTQTVMKGDGDGTQTVMKGDGDGTQTVMKGDGDGTQTVMKGDGDGTQTVMKGAAPAPPLPVFTYRVVFEDDSQVNVRADDRRESSDSYTFLLASVVVFVAPKSRVRFIVNADQD